MSKLHQSLIGLAIASASFGVAAQTAAGHGQHHPSDTSAAALETAAPATKPMPAERMANMDQHMKAMQEMHEKMAAAKTPQERQTLMAEHMKLMQEAMSMMQVMRGGMHETCGMKEGKTMSGNLADRHQMMEMRMNMMQSMMQMMMDRMSLPASR